MIKDDLDRTSMTALRSILKLTTLIILWLQSFRHINCQQSSNGAQGNVHLGDSLISGGKQTWLSFPNATFMFGFYALDNTRNPVEYELGIWYEQIPITTVVWGLLENYGPFSTGARLTLTNNGSLELFSSNLSQGALWSSDTDGLGVTGANFTDSGNFVLFNSTGRSVWQSWDHPLDTLLPGQTLFHGSVLTAMLGSHLSDADVYPYTFSIDTDGNAILLFNKTQEYWSSGTSGGSQAPNRAYFDTLGVFQLLNASGVAVSYYSSDYGAGPLRRVTLTSDGNLVIFSWDVSVSNWTATWQAWPNECEIYGYCGRNGLCSYTTTEAVCSCLPGYGLANPDLPRGGCNILAPLNCSAGLKIVQLTNTYILQDESDFLFNTANSNTCAQHCLTDSGTGDTLACVASTLDNEGLGFCREKRTKFFSAYQSPVIAAETFVKLCHNQVVTLTPLPGTVSNSGNNQISLVVAVGCLSGLAAILMVLLAWPYLARRQLRFESLRLRRCSSPVDYVPGAPVRFSYRELQRATKNFSETLGTGGFGKVYKGELSDHTVVAVKQLEDVVEQGEREFRTEVAVIGSTHHVNLVHLHGFCTERSHRLLVYEYLSNGSLDNYLIHGSGTTTSSSFKSGGSAASSTSQPQILDWPTRFSIALGTARGITYLHEECRQCIVHCDIKPENILLDEQFCPKVSDFGLAKLLGLRGRARHITSIRGTRGYLAPEWGANLSLTAKADVFSYGMVLLELVVGKRALDAMAGESQQIRFPAWVYRELMDGSLMNDIKEKAAKTKWLLDLGQFERAVQTAFWCIQDEPTLRPTMGKVVQMLEGTISVEPPPAPLSLHKLY